jgi:hypothetical protein
VLGLQARTTMLGVLHHFWRNVQKFVWTFQTNVPSQCFIPFTDILLKLPFLLLNLLLQWRIN